MHKLIGAGLAGLLILAAPAGAATRSYIVTDFDSLRLEAPVEVEVTTGRGVSAHGDGDADMLSRIDLTVSARTLTIRLKPSPFEMRRDNASGPARLRLTVPTLRRVQLEGAGSLRADGLDKSRAEVLSSGSGSIAISGIDTDVLGIVQTGSGSIGLGGKAKSAAMHVAGSGAIAARELGLADLDLTLEGSASVEASAERSAKVVAIGPGSVTVDGKAACTVRHTGGGMVRCGGDLY